VALLLVKFGTMLVAEAAAVSAIFVPDAVPEFTCKIKVNVALALRARLLPSVQVMVPAVPAVRGEHVHPTGGVIDWKFVLGGVVCVKVTVVAAAGPLLVTVWV